MMMMIGRHWLRRLAVTVLIKRGGEGAEAAAAIGSKCLRLPFLGSGENFNLRWREMKCSWRDLLLMPYL